MSVGNIIKSIQDIMRQDTGVDGDAQRISQLCWMFFLKIIDDQDQELELLDREYRSPIPKKFQWRAWAADPEGITGEAYVKASRELSDIEPVVARIGDLRAAERASAPAWTGDTP